MSSKDRKKQKALAKAHRGIRSYIRRFKPLSIVEKAVVTLHDPRIADPGRWFEEDGRAGIIRSYPPWNLLLLIKWAFQCGDLGAVLLPVISDAQFIELVNKVHRLGRFEDPLKFKGVRLFFKNMAFQQFFFQQAMDSGTIARPSLIFSKVGGAVFEKPFETAVGIPLEHYFDLAFALLSRFLAANPPQVNVSLQYFEPVFAVYGRDVVQRFLDALSLPPEEVAAYLADPKAHISHPILQIYEQTPLRKYPLLRHKRVYISYAPAVLFDRLAHFPYEMLRQTDPAWFGEKFGPVFEEYIRQNLLSLDRPFLSEVDLQKLVGGRLQKCVDFVVPYDDATVLIEAKGIELAPLARISPSVDVIARSLKSTAVKAVAQASRTLRILLEATGVPKAMPAYCLIVTYKQLYLGTARDLVGELGPDERRKLLGESDAIDESLPLHHIYFISIDELERAVALERAGVATLSQSLALAVSHDATPQTSRFVLGQHLNELGSGARSAKHLLDEFTEIADRVKRRFETRAL